jgi:hypothetical protein
VDDAIVVVEAVERHIEEGLAPKAAAIKAMEEISGPVIGIALVLSAVFVPTAFIPGITGRLYQQFAVTIAFSVMLSAFNALTLSPALAALLLRPKTSTRGLLSAFFAWFNRVFANATEWYVRVCGFLIRKSAIAIVLLVGFAVGAGWFGNKVPASFLPDEDQGYLYVNVQLPIAASLQRTDEVAAKIESVLAKTPGIEHTNTIIGFSLLSFVRTSYNAFFFVTLKPWDERKLRSEQLQAIKQHINEQLSSLPEGVAFSFSPPAIPGVGTSGGFTFVLEDRAGMDLKFLSSNLQTFLTEARKRPEIAGLSTTSLASVPQLYADVDRAKVIKQGVAVKDVYQTLQTFMGGLFINYFNRFGRQWQVYVEAEGDYRTRPENVGQFYVRNDKGGMVPLASITRFEPRDGPEFTMRFNEYRAAQINGAAAPGYSAEQAMKALEDVFQKTRHVLSGEESAGRYSCGCNFRILSSVCVFDPRGIVRKLVSSVQRASQHSGRNFRSVFHSMVAAHSSHRAATKLHGADRKRCLLTNWLGDADWLGGQERNLDRGICKGAIRTGQAFSGSGARRSAPAASPYLDDFVRIHLGSRPTVDRYRRGSCSSPNHGDSRHRRHAGCEPYWYFLHSRHVLYVVTTIVVTHLNMRNGPHFGHFESAKGGSNHARIKGKNHRHHWGQQRYRTCYRQALRERRSLRIHYWPPAGGTG